MAAPVYILHVETPSSACRTGKTRRRGHVLPRAQLTPVVRTRELSLGYSDHKKAHHWILE